MTFRERARPHEARSRPFGGMRRPWGYVAKSSGYLGGDVSMEERYRLRDKHITPIACRAVDAGVRDQCRCGEMRWVKWRGRWYCVRCARWVRRLNGELKDNPK